MPLRKPGGRRNMAIISLSYKYLERLTGTDRDTILKRLPMIGSEIRTP